MTETEVVPGTGWNEVDVAVTPMGPVAVEAPAVSNRVGDPVGAAAEGLACACDAVGVAAGVGVLAGEPRLHAARSDNAATRSSPLALSVYEAALPLAPKGTCLISYLARTRSKSSMVNRPVSSPIASSEFTATAAVALSPWTPPTI